METLSRYRQVITTILSDLAEVTTQDSVATLPLFDSSHDNYLLLAAGCDGVRGIHHIVAHLRIQNDKIWVEADNTDARSYAGCWTLGFSARRSCWRSTRHKNAC